MELASMEIKKTGNFARLCANMSSTMAVLRVLIIALFLALQSALLFAASATTDEFVPVAKPDIDNLDQGLFEDALPVSTLPKAKPGEWLVTLTADITVNYTFNDAAKDNVKVIYHVELGGPMEAKAAMIRGTAKIKTNIEGFLAKWNNGQCLLQVSIADVPYEMTIVREGDTKLKLGLLFKQKILEDWQSLCTFLDAPDSRFYTKGEPEKWIGEALQKTEPDLNKLSMTISEKEKTETKFKINKYTVKDGSIGSADIDGSGTVTVTPPVQPVEEKK